MNNILSSFSKIDDWIYGHSINNDYKNIDNDMTEIQKLVIRNIPKKVELNTFKCPNCNELLVIHKKYCYNCGQALDWSNN